MLEQQLNETRQRKQMEISKIDGKLSQEYEAKMQQSLNVRWYFILKLSRALKIVENFFCPILTKLGYPLVIYLRNAKNFEI